MAVSKVERALTRLVPSPEEFSIETWASLLEKFEERAIQFVGLDLPPGYFGACIIVTEASEGVGRVWYPLTEYIVYSNDLAPIHREHVKAHELAHIALGHPTLILSPEEFVNCSPELIHCRSLSHLCCRAADPHDQASFVRDDEDAEMLTRLVYQRVLVARQHRGLRQQSSQEEFERGIQRLGIR